MPTLSLLSQQFLPHLSSSDERAFVVMNKDGDFAIVKGRWNGFCKKEVRLLRETLSQSPFQMPRGESEKGKNGSAGRLVLHAFNLLKNTVQKMHIPNVDGSCSFVIGGERVCESERVLSSFPVLSRLSQTRMVDCLLRLCTFDQRRQLSISLVSSVWELSLFCVIQIR